jgi:transcriptional regulator with XRE-family HTH domain
MSDLQKYLDDNSITQREFAARVSSSPSYINEIVAGSKTPGLKLAFAIERATGGAVPASSWIPADEPAPIPTPAPQTEADAA